MEDDNGKTNLLGNHISGWLHRGSGRELRLAMPDEEVHRFINDLERSVGTYLLGRRMYKTMMVWETDPDIIWL